MKEYNLIAFHCISLQYREIQAINSQKLYSKQDTSI